MTPCYYRLNLRQIFLIYHFEMTLSLLNIDLDKIKIINTRFVSKIMSSLRLKQLITVQ